MKENVKNFCGARLDKIKSIGAMIGKEKHNLRDRSLEFGDNINLELSQNNKIIKLNGYKDNLVDTYNYMFKKCKRVRKDHIKCLEYVFYRSDCFDKQCEYDKFRECTINFIKNYFKGCPVCIVEHNDEGVQHFHVFVVPCREKNGEFKFCASDFCGKKKMLSDLQTFYANSCAECNLKRGKEKSLDKHISIQNFYAEQNEKLINEYQSRLDYNKQLLDDVINKNNILESMSDTLDNKIKHYENVNYTDTIDNMQRAIIAYKNGLEETLQNDDGSEFFDAIKQCIEYFKNILIQYNIINKNNDEKTKKFDEER